MPIISFSHPKGGVGKSTLCFNFLSYLQLKNIDFICVDLDGQNSISSLNKIRKINGLKPFNIISFKSESELIEFIKNNKNKFTVIDTGGFDSGFNRIVISISNQIITPFGDSPLEILRLRDFDKILDEIQNQINEEIKIDLVINRISSSIKSFNYLKKQIDDCKHFKLLQFPIRDRVAFKNSLIEGKGVLEIDSKSLSDANAKSEIELLFDEILKQVKE
ncbi:ParA family protein [Campylobacter sp. US33a]|uniref:ParA family protein n=1 Tax=Campylobacter sp. US33a TaxID=2498120 RepID=UPI0014195377|nr:ParA family protein [Campylobacter sp. US33a]